LRATDLLGKPKVSAVSKGRMRLVASQDVQVDKLLAQYGLKSLTGRADFDMLLEYDHARPDSWKAHVDLVMADVRADTDFADVSFSDLQGRVRMRREKSLVVALENLSGRMNESPIHVDGKLSGVGTRSAVLNATVRTKGVDLALARALHPTIEDLGLAGNLDLNVGVHFPRMDPMTTRLTGRAKIRDLDLHLEAPSLRVEDGDGDIEFSGDTLNLKRMTLRANDQDLSLSGQLTDIREPRIQLRAVSQNLNVDRLLASLLPSQPSPGPSVKGDETPREAAASGEEGDKKELPALLGRLTAQVEAEVTLGEYRGQGFHDLKLQAAYERGMLKSHAFDAGIGDGHMNVNALHLRSPSLDIESSAVLDLVPRQLEGSAQVTVLGALDKGLGYVPIMGGATASMMKLYMDIQGPLENPNIVARPGEKARDAAGQIIRAPGETGKKVFKGMGKGLDKVF